MSKHIIILFLALLLCIKIAFAQNSQGEDLPFTYGEVLDFEVSYGWLNLADAKLEIHRKPEYVNNREHMRIDAYGKTKGAAKVFGKVKDNWGSILNPVTMLPIQSYRHIEEGNYRKHEVIDFGQEAKVAYTTLYDRDNKNVKEKRFFNLPGQVQDIVSGFYFLRSKDLRALKSGETIVIQGFFDKEVYKIQLIYEGRESLETVFGIQETYVFSPKIPKNKIFRGDYPIKVWVTQDENKIPVKIKANLFLGSLDLDLVSAKGLKNPY